jgi:DNA-binding MarR family transcriptional regulator
LIVSAAEIETSIDTIARQCVAQRLRLLNRVVTNLYDAQLRPLRLKASQVNILVATWKLGLATPQKVCRILHLDPSTLCRNVERMRAKGWLEVVPGEDARAQPFRLTSAGRKLLEKAVPRWQVAQTQVRRLLGKELVDLIDDAAQALDRSPVEQ